MGAKEHRTAQIDIGAFGGSALTDASIDVPDADELSNEIPVTYVPARNTVFLSYALAGAEVLGAKDIFIGVNAVDYSGYPDCRPEFIGAFQSVANLATKHGVEGIGFKIHTPLIDLTKGQIIELPKKSTLIDYAYSIHTDLGNKYSAGIVDGELKPPNTVLKNGQRIIIKKADVSNPDPAWLNFVISVKARTSIRNYLRSIHETDAISLGEKLLKACLEELQVSIDDVPKKTLEFILSEHKYQTINELYKYAKMLVTF